MKVHKALRPSVILTVVFIMQMCFYLLYALDLIPSYRLNHISSNVYGYLGITSFYIICLLLLKVIEKTKKPRNKRIESINKRKVYFLVYLCWSISMLGMLRLLAELIGKYGLFQLLSISLNGMQMDYLVRGAGNTVLINFSVAAIILLGSIYESSFKYKVQLAVSFILLFLYSIFLSSRIMIIQGVFYWIVIIVRKKMYDKKISIRKTLILCTFVLLFLVITSGLRDYNRGGEAYTNSPILWGLSRISDYVISSLNYSLESPSLCGNNMTFPNGTFELLTYIIGVNEADSLFNTAYMRTTFGAPEYTNVGGFGQIYSDFNMLFPILCIVLSIIISKTWKSFHSGHFFGFVFYPIMLYSLIEMWRIYYLGTAMFETLILIMMVFYLILRKDIVYVDDDFGGRR